MGGDVFRWIGLVGSSVPSRLNVFTPARCLEHLLELSQRFVRILQL